MWTKIISLRPQRGHSFTISQRPFTFWHTVIAADHCWAAQRKFQKQLFKYSDYYGESNSFLPCFVSTCWQTSFLSFRLESKRTSNSAGDEHIFILGLLEMNTLFHIQNNFFVLVHELDKFSEKATPPRLWPLVQPGLASWLPSPPAGLLLEATN